MSKARVSSNKNSANKRKKSSKASSNVNANKISLPNPTRSSSSKSSSITARVEPWNHSQFLKRVSTFNSLKWHIKRRDVNPLLCARFGWECVDKNTLQCNGCKTKINYKTNHLWSAEINNKMAFTFLENIKICHTPQCGWKNNPCNKLFEQLPTNENIIKQELINNISTWTITDNNSFYLVPIIDKISKNIMIKSIANNNNIISNKSYDNCTNILLLSVCGWNFNVNKYIQCRYCNKCIALNCYEYKKVLALIPNNNNSNSFLHQINEDKQNEEENNVNQMDNILNIELPINDTKSVINRLSKLGLKIRNSKVKRLHHCQIYDTQSLQKEAHFNNNNNMRSSFGAFGSAFGGYKSAMRGCGLMSVKSLQWPKQSILTQTNTKVNTRVNTKSNTNTNSMKKNKKRRRNQMSMSMDNSDNEIYDEIKTETMSQSLDECPRKRMRLSTTNSIESGNTNTNNSNNSTNSLRKNRKRKTMDSECNESISCNYSSEFIPTKKRRIGSISKSISCNTPIVNEKKRSRKRKFDHVFPNNNNNNKYDKQMNKKRVRLDTPNVNTKLYFDPINLHNNYCPFKNKYKYQENHKDIFGWNYCAKLLPNDIIYIQQIADQSKKSNQAKSRFA